MMRKVDVTVEVQLPMLPNFLLTEDGQPIDVADLTDDGLRALGAEWTEELIAHAQQRRQRRAAPDAR